MEPDRGQYQRLLTIVVKICETRITYVLTLRVRNPDLAILASQRRERAQTFVRDSDDLCGGGRWAMSEVRSDDIKDSGFGNVWVT